MKLKETRSDDEKFVQSCMDGPLLDIEKLLESPSLTLIKKALNEHPIHFYEVLVKLLENKEYKKLFEISVDLRNETLRDAVLTEEYELPEKTIYSISTKGAKTLGIERVQSQNMKLAEDLLNKNKKLRKDYVEPAKLKQYFDLIRELIISEVSWKIDSEKLISELTKDFFLGNLDDNPDLVIIKLCLLLETKLKVYYTLDGDLSEMLDRYIRAKFYGDDGYGYDVQLVTYTPNILHKLRITRNNLVHSNKTPIKPLERKELIDAIDYIIKM